MLRKGITVLCTWVVIIVEISESAASSTKGVDMRGKGNKYSL